MVAEISQLFRGPDHKASCRGIPQRGGSLAYLRTWALPEVCRVRVALFVLLDKSSSAVSCFVRVASASMPLDEFVRPMSCEFESIDAGGFAGEIMVHGSLELCVNQMN